MAREPGVLVAGVRHSAAALVDAVLELGVGTIVLDLTMPGPSPLLAIGAVASAAPWCRVIAFSGHDDPATRDAARRAGAWEFVGKHGDPMDIVLAVRRAAAAARG
jgi:DNA-binding NarL/FixJ family response regulator